MAGRSRNRAEEYGDSEEEFMPPATNGEPGKRRRSAKRPEPEPHGAPYLRYFKHAVLAVISLALLLVAAAKVDEVLHQDPRFVLASGDPDAPFANIEVRNARYSDAEQVRDVFRQDLNSSVYLIPLGERKEELSQKVKWVRDASLSRLWPNRLVVEIQERKPVAFLQVPPRSDGLSGIRLVDGEGELLSLPTGISFDLPVLLGVSAGDDIEVRRDRVRRLEKLLRELGDLAGPVSEVDLTNPNNAIITYTMQGRVMVLILGNKNYRGRLERFLAFYPQIQADRPDARNFDLRDDRSPVAAPAVFYGR